MEKQKAPRFFIVVRDDIIESRILTVGIYALMLAAIFRTEPWFTIFGGIGFVFAMALIVRLIYVVRNMNRLKINKAEMKYSSYITTANFILWLILLYR